MRKVRYAVVGLGHIAQTAILPAFQNARKNSVLAALFSDDPVKRRKLGRKYGVPAYSYESYGKVLQSGEFDAVYIALPNHLHADYAIRAARESVHVLCEKPMANSPEECGNMIRAAEEGEVKLMVAYRLHLEEGTLNAIRLAHSGKLGEPKIFSSVFTNNIREGNIRLEEFIGGGPLYDIGIYCINAARSIFGSEPESVFAFCAKGDDPRFRDVEESVTAVLKFSRGRVASFSCSFGAASVQTYQIVGTKGELRMDLAYDYEEDSFQRLTIKRKTKILKYKRKDQFAAQLIYFSGCILSNRAPEPSGKEGIADIRIIRALYQAAKRGKPVTLGAFPAVKHPSPDQVITRPPAKDHPELVHTEPPTQFA